MSEAPALREIDLQRQVVQLAEMLGWEHIHFRPAQTKHGWRTPGSGSMAKGWPDLTLVRPRDRRLIFAELKAEGQKPTPAQLDVLTALQALDWRGAPKPEPFSWMAKVEVYVWRPSDFDEIQAVLR